MATRKKPVAKRKARLTVDDVREMALALPSTEERPSYGTPGFRVSDKLFARVLDEDSIVIKVDFEHREALLDSKPDVFEVTPHYQDWPMVIVRLATVERPMLQSLLKESWLRCASPRLLRIHGG
ncbi:MmcQ/YjbR family DNA-binding protein [Corallococcus interemptor]|uniref:MmcQ/YjbR family DNA-binding protein n=1 Tax=Corallococcus interemptor TaxID=2316720 RepID=UPI003D03D4FB